MKISADESRIRLKMPFARILYWETARKTPDKVTLELEFEDGSLHTYEVATFKMLDQSLETLEQRKMMLLLPFCLLKFRKEVKKPGTTSEKRKQLAEEMRNLLHKIEALIEHSSTQGLLSNGDARMVMERIEQMHEELYNPYPEFEEATMDLRERLRTPVADAIREAEREAERKGEQKGKREGKREGEREGEQKERKHLLDLLNQNYTVEQLKEILAKEVNQTTTTTQ
jgi:flagellar biosynthesis/type III secretory pathway protein FliH